MHIAMITMTTSDVKASSKIRPCADDKPLHAGEHSPHWPSKYSYSGPVWVAHHGTRLSIYVHISYVTSLYLNGNSHLWPAPTPLVPVVTHVVSHEGLHWPHWFATCSPLTPI